jgi:DNA-binding Lrp family transcriptional regulator
MVHAFIMVKTGAGESEQLLGPIGDLAAVTEAHIIAGEYDIIAEVDAEEVYDALKTATSDIQGLQGISETRTYISLDE